MITVISSNIAAVGHDATTNTLTIKFTNQSVYTYENVPTETYLLILNAGSVGKMFNKLVKAFPIAFPFKRIA
jgi:hypothetical protein